jgi:putative FmdB family regulatory protein
MPTYELTCDECGNRFERFLTRILRTDDKVCPSCGSMRVTEGFGGGYVARKVTGSTAPECVPRGGFG